MMLSGLRYMAQNGLTAIGHPVSLAHVACVVQYNKWKNETYHCPVDNHIVDVTEMICRTCEGCEMIMDKLDYD